MQTKNGIKACYVRRGDIIRFDTFGVLESKPRQKFDPSDSLAYDLRVEEIRLNGLNNFIVTGEPLRYFRYGGIELTQAEIDQVKNYRSNLRGVWLANGKESISLGNAVRIISSDRTQPYLRVKTEPSPQKFTREGFFHWITFVRDEVTRFYAGYVPHNLDHNYLAHLLSRHVRHSGYGSLKFAVGVHNLKKFRADLKRNVNRALMKITDAEICENFIEAKEGERIGIDHYDCSLNERREILDLLDQVFSELSKKWAIFDEDSYLYSSKVRFDKLERPHFDPVRNLSASKVFREAMNEAYVKLSPEESDDESEGSSYSDFDNYY